MDKNSCGSRCILDMPIKIRILGNQCRHVGGIAILHAKKSVMIAVVIMGVGGAGFHAGPDQFQRRHSAGGIGAGFFSMPEKFYFLQDSFGAPHIAEMPAGIAYPRRTIPDRTH